MKHYYRSVIFFLVVFLSVAGYPSVAQGPADRAAARKKGMEIMRAKLQLTDKQVASLNNLTDKYEAKVRNNPAGQQQPSVRQKQMADYYEDYRNGIRKILTPVQWKQYEGIDKQRRDSMANKLKTKKIQINPGQIRQ
jgi:Tfp pilus assembly protein PilO